MSGERRLAACVEAWPEAEEGMYDPRCCRFPKSCSPYPYPEQVAAGNVELEPTAPVVQPADQPAPDTTAGDALREAIAGGLRAVAHWCQHDPCTPCLIISDEEFDAQIEVTAMHGSTPTRIEGKPEAIADALLSGPLAQLLADAADGREAVAKLQRVRALHNDTRNRGICTECSDEIAIGWPCATIEALEGTA